MESFFPDVFGFLFDNVPVLSLCLHLSFLSLYLLIATIFIINYGLECVTILDIAYISYSAHILFDYKLVLVFCNWGSKCSLVFYMLFELSVLML